MSLSEINKREKDFHNKLHLSEELERKSQGRFYKALYGLNSDFLNILKNETKIKDVLDFGCGIGNFTKKVINFNPKKIVAVDISEEAIKKAKNNHNLNRKNIEFRVENCENLNLNSDSFDVVYGSGILHHLNLNKSLSELKRILRKDGKIIFIEPMATNPIINLYRKFTPNARTSDEHPFKLSDIEFIKSLFANVEVKYYGFLTLVCFLFYKEPEKSNLFQILKKMDEKILNSRYFKFLAWSVLIKAKKS
jgi:SAM-dependent methyltransferase